MVAGAVRFFKNLSQFSFLTEVFLTEEDFCKIVEGTNLTLWPKNRTLILQTLDELWKVRDNRFQQIVVVGKFYWKMTLPPSSPPVSTSYEDEDFAK